MQNTKIKDYLSLLGQSLEKNFINYKKIIPQDSKVGVLVSGGVDSSIIAKLASQHFKNLYLLSLDTKKGKDLPFVKILKKHLKKPLLYYQVPKKEINKALPQVKKILKKTKIPAHLTNLSLALAFFLILKKAKGKNIDHIFTGQGPDDLFAGYHKYQKIPFEKLKKAVRKGAFEAQKDVQRDLALAKTLKVKLFNPYLEKEFIKTALLVPAHLKLFKKEEKLIPKYILRKLAQNLGLPQKIVWRKKSAFQYSTGLQKIVRRLTLTDDRHRVSDGLTHWVSL